MLALSIINVICFIVFLISMLFMSGSTGYYALFVQGLCVFFVGFNTLVMSVWTVYKYLT